MYQLANYLKPVIKTALELLQSPGPDMQIIMKLIIINMILGLYQPATVLPMNIIRKPINRRICLDPVTKVHIIESRDIGRRCMCDCNFWIIPTNLIFGCWLKHLALSIPNHILYELFSSRVSAQNVSKFFSPFDLPTCSFSNGLQRNHVIFSIHNGNNCSM